MMFWLSKPKPPVTPPQSPILPPFVLPRASNAPFCNFTPLWSSTDADPAALKKNPSTETVTSGIRFVDQIDSWYARFSGSEAAVMQNIKKRLSDGDARAWLDSLAQGGNLSVNEVRKAVLRDFGVEKWREMMEFRYGTGASGVDKDGNPVTGYRSVEDGGPWPKYFFSGEFVLKADYIEDIERLTEMVVAKTLDHSNIKAAIEKLEDAKKEQESQNTTTADTLTRIAEIVVNSLRGIENTGLGEENQETLRVCEKFGALADQVLELEKEISRLRVAVGRVHGKVEDGAAHPES